MDPFPAREPEQGDRVGALAAGGSEDDAAKSTGVGGQDGVEDEHPERTTRTLAATSSRPLLALRHQLLHGRDLLLLAGDDGVGQGRHLAAVRMPAPARPSRWRLGGGRSSWCSHIWSNSVAVGLLQLLHVLVGHHPGHGHAAHVVAAVVHARDVAAVGGAGHRDRRAPRPAATGSSAESQGPGRP